jgi:hypothetical protein
MKTNKRFFYLTACLCFILLAACSLPSAPLGEPTATLSPPSATPLVVKETVLVVVSPSPQATGTPVPTAASATATPTKKVVVPPTPTPLTLLNIPIEGGDSNNMFFARLVFPDFGPAAKTFLWFRVYAHKPVSSKIDGENIESVTFTILNSKDQTVHYREEKQAGYCAFGGGEPDCVVWNFAENHYTWPDGGKMVSGTYTIKILAVSKDNVDMFGEAKFTIQVP